ncbi:MAG: type II secretion system protein [Candidatus Microsaccharimonas sp.]
MNRTQNIKGFTIIEVVLVLAIAGLIFLMVFIALPSLQQGQRNTARKNEASTVLSAIDTFRGNNRGTDPTAAQITTVVNGDTTGTLDSKAKVFVVATAYGTARTLTASTTATQTSDNVNAADEVNVFIGYKCGTTNTSLIKGTAKQVAVTVLQEGGAGSVYCQNS